jgi:putative ABC transport system permease protein
MQRAWLRLDFGDNSPMLLTQAVRSLRRTPLFTVTVILTLALGLAAVGTMFAVVHGFLLSPLPYGSPDRLVTVQLELADGSRINHSPALQATWRRFSSQLDDVALHRTGSANVWSGSEEVAADHLVATWVTASTMQLLQAAPLLGRQFTAEEERRDGPEAVILSEAEWRTRFAATPDVIGRTLIVNNVPRAVVGVMPARFAFPAASTRLWLPAKSYDSTTAGDFIYAALGRLAPGATSESARQELAAILPKLAEVYPRLQSGGATAAWIEEARPGLSVQALRESLTGSIAPTLWVLSAVAGLVLLVAWANVANLVLVRADAGRLALAVREALGASELRAHAPLLAESLLLGAVAAALALLATSVAISALKLFGPTDLPRLHELTIGPWTAVFIVLVALASTQLGTVVLARLVRPRHVASGLRDGSRGHTAGRSRRSLHATVTVLQIAAALVVVASSALLLRTAQRLHDVHPGFESAHVSTLRILLPYARYSDVARVAFHARLLERAGQLPSVHAAGLTAKLPLGAGSLPEQPFLLEGESRPRSLAVNVVSAGYFAAMRTPIIAGHDFRPLESQRPDELVIGQRTAATLFADPTGIAALGRTLTLDPSGPAYTIIGVVGDVRYDDLAEAPSAMVYRPQVVSALPDVQPGPLPGITLAVRSDAPADALVDAVRDIVRDLDPTVPVFDVAGMDDVVRQSTARLTLAVSLTSAAAAASLLLGMIGLYGVMAYQVALRTREFGIRIALGAEPGRVARKVVAYGLRLTAIGITAGLAVYALIVPGLRSFQASIATWDPLPLAGATLLLGCTAAIACWLPALRAAAVDPAQALRSE